MDLPPTWGIRHLQAAFVNEHGEVVELTDVLARASECVLQDASQTTLRPRAAHPGASHRAGYLHVGDVVWRVWDTLIAYGPWHVVEMWEVGAEGLIGFALLYPMCAGFNLQVHPRLRGGTSEERMLARVERWAQSRTPGRPRRHDRRLGRV